MVNVRKYGDIKFASTEARTNYLLSESNYCITKIFIRTKLSYILFFSEIVLAVNGNKHK